MKTKWLSILKYNKFLFGKQPVSQFVLFECKFLFSIIIFYFHKSDHSQDRYHTHAFDAISFKLFGSYTEHTLDFYGGAPIKNSRKRMEFFRFFPRSCFHKIGESTGCMTILLSGPWGPTWTEYVDGKLVTYSWGRGYINK